MPVITILFLWLLCTMANLGQASTVGKSHHLVPKLGTGKDGTLCISSERSALLKFKAGIFRDETHRLASWHGEECCTWSGVTCHNRTGNVVAVDLRNPKGMKDFVSINPKVYVEEEERWALGFAEVSPALLALQNLEYLDLSHNLFNGIGIPDFFGSFPNLRYLNLSHVSFTGSVPPHLGNLSSLRYLDLSNLNPATVSDIWWLSRLSRLQVLTLSFWTIQTKDWLSVLSMLPSLKELYTYECTLPSLPTSIPSLRNLSSLAVVELDYSPIQSNIPSWLWSLERLEYFSCVDCGLDGEIPDLFGNLTSLSFLNLGRNQLKGTIPLSITRNCNLRGLALSKNYLQGNMTQLIESFPRCMLDNLEVLSLGNNLFVGSLPERIGEMKALSILDLSFNALDGVFGESHLANLRELRELCLSGSSVVFAVNEGWIPEFQLTKLKLYSVNLKGSKFPAWLKNQKQLSFLALHNLSINDRLPDWFWNISSHISLLDLSYNLLRGRLPDSLVFMNHLSYLNLSNNLLDGPFPIFLPSSLQYLCVSSNLFSDPLLSNFDATSLMFLDLSSNSFNGSIPTKIFNLSSMYAIDLSYNNLTGSIPDYWINGSVMNSMNLKGNRLSGKIPASLCSRIDLSGFIIAKNRFSGELFPSLQRCNFLEIIDAGQNLFSGSIPEWVGETFQSLIYLQLQSNTFSGRVPTEIAQLPCLRVLDLSMNNFSGPIPSSIGNLSSMTSQGIPCSFGVPSAHQESFALVIKGNELEYMLDFQEIFVTSIDMSCNLLSGEIPEEIITLEELHNLNLSSNNLVGNIPMKIGNILSLESLDLSRNQLSGEIPHSISSLNFLSTMFLSYNNLSGEIPTGRQLQTLDDPSIYVGNPGLCGPPLTVRCSKGETVPIPSGSNEQEDQEEEDSEAPLFGLNSVLGFLVGFWAVYVVFLISKDLRSSYFQTVDQLSDRLFWRLCPGRIWRRK